MPLKCNTLCIVCKAEAVAEHHQPPRSLGGTKTYPLCHRCHEWIQAMPNDVAGPFLERMAAVFIKFL